MNYTLRTALQGLWHDKWLNLLCTLTIATSLLLVSLASVAYINIKTISAKLPDRFSITVFLNDDLEDERIQAIIKQIRGNSAVKKLEYITREQGLADLRRSLGDADYILEGIEGNPLPPSLEINVTRSSVSGDKVGRLVKGIMAIEGVDDAYYAPKLLRIISAASRYTDRAGAALIALLTIAGLFVSYATIKILFYSKQEEIATMKLLGATKGFMRSPFIIEGAAIGAMAGLLSFTAFVSLYALIYLRLAAQFPILREINVPVELLPAIPAAGLLVGVIGALIAIGRIRF